jgi:uncharacterized protein YdaU (DUF1376 family)
MEELSEEEVGFLMDLLVQEYQTTDNAAKMNEALAIFNKLNDKRVRVFLFSRTALVCVAGGKK